MTQKQKPRFEKKTEEQIWKENRERISEIALQHPECNGIPIFHFDGQYAFLSNFEPSPILVDGYSFENGEAAFQGFKDMTRIDDFATLRPSKAKQLGRQVTLRSDWESIKSDVMYKVVFAKFSQNEHLKKKLLETGDRLLVEGNWWNDKIWGIAGNKGENRLGEILMRVRKELKK
ncbi:hypothetical protein JMA_38260 (plasmid) [Jeotgalibacillus malaysiensis]|uniref:NADAR domain-containing protein n=1 Tax=Jeotgalibacillus malaysiensis TaxID=1508404 RepID=A0A0B5AYT0_9BACL|nr:hypothetical protein JMA_38260 [Jeotgalibacillus malaysiensis]